MPSNGIFAERAGFEPAIAFPLYTLSRRAPSTTRTPLLPLLKRTAKIRVRNRNFANLSANQLTKAARSHKLYVFRQSKPRWPSQIIFIALCRCDSGQLLRCSISFISASFCSHINQITAFISFPPERNRRQIGRICFQHNIVPTVYIL